MRTAVRRGKGTKHVQVEAQLQAQTNRQAAWFTLLFAAFQAVAIAALLIAERVQLVHANSVPTVCESISLAARCLVLAATWWSHYMGRYLWAPQQVCQGLLVCLDGTLLSLQNPEVQYYLFRRFDWLSALGDSPNCGMYSDGRREGDLCAMDVQMYQTVIVLLIKCTFSTLFTLRFRHAAWSTPFAFAVVQVMRAVAVGGGSLLLNVFTVQNAAGPLVLLLFLLTAKRKIESLLRHILLELFEKQKEVVKERVKRCEAEFNFENGISPCAALAPRAASVAGSSSGGAFCCDFGGEAEDAETPLSRLQELASLGHREHWLVNSERLTIEPQRVLGTGGFGTVFPGCLAGSPVAVKLARKEGARIHLRQLANELRVFRHVRHPNVALFHGACLEPELGGLGIVLELVEGQTLDGHVLAMLPDRSQVADQTRWSLLLDISSAFYYLHTLDPVIVHGDIKPSNIMVERGSTRAKILDFGLSRILSPHALKLGGTRIWMAPEVRDGSRKEPSTAADVYSYGLLVFFVATGRKPARGRLFWPADQFSQQSQQTAALCLNRFPKRRSGMPKIHEDLLGWPQGLGWPTLPAGGAPNVPWPEALKILNASEQDVPEDTLLPAAQGPPAGDPPRAAARQRAEAKGQAAQSQARWSPTPMATKLPMLVELMERWHCPARGSTCCAFHGAAEDLVTMFHKMQALPCEATTIHAGPGYMQCPVCLALCPKRNGEFVCEFCKSSSSHRQLPGEEPDLPAGVTMAL